MQKNESHVSRAALYSQPDPHQLNSIPLQSYGAITEGVILHEQRSTTVVSSGSNIPYDDYTIPPHVQQVRDHYGQHPTTNISSTFIERYITTSIPRPRQIDFASIRKALESYYERQLTIRLVSGMTLDLEKCYINLAIVEATLQQEIDKEKLKNQSQTFNRMQSYEELAGTKLESAIQIEQLFKKRKLRDGKENIPKRILIQGRAGIGKTTFCKKLVHRFINGEWSDRFEAVLWMPLRELKVLKSRNFEDLVKEKYIPQFTNDQKNFLARHLSEGIQQDKVLFILDGLDEIIQDIQADIIFEQFVTHLLQQTHVIITSRPSGVDYSLLPPLDLELETVGFSTANIKNYVNHVLDGDAAKSVMEFIEQTPIIQSLANIPVQLDVICHSWKSLPKDTETLTVTKLYKTMVDKLLCNDAVRVGKPDYGRAITIQLMKGRNEQRVRNMMSAELEYLSYLAFDGIRNNQIEFDYDRMDEVICELNSLRGSNLLPLDLLEILKQTSFLHSVKGSIDPQDEIAQESYHFIHLTFQEYFAAIWISEYFKPKTSSSVSTPISTNRDDIILFIQKNKYNPRYEIVWQMIAGQLEGTALNSYFELLQAPPRDLIGLQHQYLIIRCFKEAHSQISTSQIQLEMNQWLRFEMKYRKETFFPQNRGLLRIVPEEILINSMDDDQIYTIRILEELACRRYLTASSVTYLIQMLSNDDWYITSTVLKALGNQSTLQEPIITAIVSALQHSNSNVRGTAVNVLGNRSNMSDFTVNLIINALLDQEPSVRRTAVCVLGTQSTMAGSVITALIAALQDQDSYVRFEADYILYRESTMSDSAITAVVNALSNQDATIRIAAVNMLGNQSTVSDAIVTSLIIALQDPDSSVQKAAAIALSKKSPMSGSTITALIAILQDQDSSVRKAAINILGKQSPMSESC